MSVDMFIKIGDIVGEAKDSKHGGEIDVLAWSWGMSQSGTMHVGGGGGSGKVNMQDLSVTKYIDKSSPVLMQMCSDGSQMPLAKLTIRKAGGKNPLEYLIISMKDVIITACSTGGSSGEDRLTENVTLNFAKVKFEYTAQKQDGSADGGAIPMIWDIPGNTPAF
ncbi:MAG: type VI secretion system tube protein Hcp [Candidatus Eisenbacteria bacterium]